MSKNKVLKVPAKPEQTDKPISKISSSKKKYFYLILFLIPVLFFVLLELGLRLFNYGVDTTLWIPATEGKIIVNPNLTKRYFFTTGNAPVTIQDVFDAEKKVNAVRIFVLGESSAAGYPFMPNGSFSRYLRQRLELAYPDRSIEVINLGMTAINTFTIRDIFKGVLEQKPDAILFYTGHNEYYGALGVGSVESFGYSRQLVNLTIWLNKFKTVELIRNIIKGIAGSLNSDKKTDGTLMARIAADQSIVLNSEKYKDGLKQFEGNMRDMLDWAKEAKIPVILGTLVSNIKDQKPFVSANGNGLPNAQSIFDKANSEYQKGNFAEAKKLFKYAKDLDALRFRGSTDLNNLIKKLGSEYNLKVADIEKTFEENSKNGIVGDDLMTDHLHPNLFGFHLIGKTFYQALADAELLPDENPRIPFNMQDSITQANFKFTQLDSTAALFRIKILKNDWPYVSQTEKKPLIQLVSLNNFIDTAAYNLIVEDRNWDAVHKKIAERYINSGDVESFKREMDVVIDQYPVIVENYNIVANELIRLGRPNEAEKYLRKGYKVKPTAFTTKYLGIIELSRQNHTEAKKFLNQSLSFNSNDSQIYYNLAGAYVQSGDFSRALELVNKSLDLTPNYPQAKSLQAQLKAALHK